MKGNKENLQEDSFDLSPRKENKFTKTISNIEVIKNLLDSAAEIEQESLNFKNESLQKLVAFSFSKTDSFNLEPLLDKHPSSQFKKTIQTQKFEISDQTKLIEELEERNERLEEELEEKNDELTEMIERLNEKDSQILELGRINRELRTKLNEIVKEQAVKSSEIELKLREEQNKLKETIETLKWETNKKEEVEFDLKEERDNLQAANAILKELSEFKDRKIELLGIKVASGETSELIENEFKEVSKRIEKLNDQ